MTIRNITKAIAMNLRVLPATVMAAVTVLAVSCSEPDEKPGEFIGIPFEGWEYGSLLTFNAAGDTLGLPLDHIDFSVRHTNDYPYANLWVELTYATTDTTVADTFDIRLADGYGKWLGSGSGPTILHTQSIRPSRVPATGTSFGVRHIMRVDCVRDIEQIGLRVCPITKANKQEET